MKKTSHIDFIDTNSQKGGARRRREGYGERESKGRMKKYFYRKPEACN